MSLPNEHFQDFPIEFKQINPVDFPHFEVEDKVVLELQNGYIAESFIENISINESNTVVLNCGVGSGKTTAIIKAIKQFYEHEEYLIIVASPFVSLVQQYYLDIQEKAEIPVSQIYRNEWIGERNDITYVDKRVHVVTINTLLGNPGEDSIINSQAKRRYLNEMVGYCESNNKKVIFIYDEIHDSIHNFKEKYIFNLWKWRNVIHKNFVISATYNEASKIVIEYLAELTHNKLKILEAERVRIREGLSDLYLYYDNANSYNNENGNLVGIVENIFNRGLDLDILCFSKKLCKDIINSKEEGVGKMVYEKYGDNINDCTSGLENNARMNRDVHKNRFNKDKCNIGTNFKSGVSIEKENHAFILIFPPVSAKGDFKSGYGIFNGGINSIIQALARKRKRGEIHVLLPRPTKFNFDSFPFDESQKLIFSQYFESIQYQNNRPSSNGIVDRKTIDYISLEQQNGILSDFYINELKANVQDSISYIERIQEDRIDKVRLEYPEFKLFKLEDGEKYLADKYKFLGKDLSGYLSYCAATNQMVNCQLVGTNWKPIQNFKVEMLQYNFDKFYENYFTDDWFSSLRDSVSDKYIYHEIRNEIFSNNQVKLYDLNGVYKFIKPYEDKLFETQLIAFVQRKIYRNNHLFIRKYEQSNGWVKDSQYTRGDYFASCISHANRLNRSNDILGDTKLLVEAYLIMDVFRNKIINSIESTEILGIPVDFIHKTPSTNFITDEELDSFRFMYTTLCEKDNFIQKDVFDFKRIFLSNSDDDIKTNRFYTYLKNDFFELKTRKIAGVDEDMILNIYSIPDPLKTLDFLTLAVEIIPEESMQQLNWSIDE